MNIRTAHLQSPNGTHLLLMRNELLPSACATSVVLSDTVMLVQVSSDSWDEVWLSLVDVGAWRVVQVTHDVPSAQA